MDRVRGDQADNIEQAIQHYRQALGVFTRVVYPEDWAWTLDNLGAAYNNRIRGERAENIELAIDYFQKALDLFFTKSTLPEKWALTRKQSGKRVSQSQARRPDR